jgi:transcriptional regulator with XRE-family HTH domain
MRPHQVIAERVRTLRKGRGMSAQRLAEEMTKQGIRWDRSIVANLENGRRENVTVAELLAAAYVLNVAPVHLIVPPLPSPLWGTDDAGGQRPKDQPNEPNDAQPYAVTPTTEVPAYLVRRFVRGESALPGMNERLFFAEIPPQEWSPLLERMAADRKGGSDGQR